MSRELLLHLRDEVAFDPYPRREALGVYHVPFGDLVPGLARPPEQAVAEAAQRSEAVAVVGESGRGKSSLLSAALGPLVEGIAPFLVPISGESTQLVREPRAMAFHVLRTIADVAGRHGLVEQADAAVQQGAPVRLVGGDRVNAKVAVTLGVISAEVGRQARDASALERSAAAILEVTEQVLVGIGGRGLTPVLVFDDTDKWLRSSGFEQPEPLVRGFFARTLLQLRELSCALVASVHPEYLTMAEVPEALERVVGTRVDVPVLPDVDALGKVLASRVGAHTVDDPERWAGWDLADIIAPDALQRLFDHYRSGLAHELRSVVRAVHAALAEACDAGMDRLTAELVDVSVTTWTGAA